MWSPTHIQVTVLKARGLLIKGKNGTNNCFVTIALGKDKYQTSVKDKAENNVDWHEECELAIPDKGNRAELILTCLHRNNFGIDEFLGQVTLPLNEMGVYERPRSKWHKLASKPGKENKKDRGELEVRISFTVKAGSLTDLSKKEKHKSSLGQMASNVGGSLLSLGTLEKRKGLKNFAKSLGSKVHLSGKKKKDKQADSDSMSGSFSSIGTPGSGQFQQRRGQTMGDADPGVISEDEDEFTFENLSHKSSGSSLNIKTYTGANVQRTDSLKTSSPVSAKSQPRVETPPGEVFLNVPLDANTKSMTLPAKPPRGVETPPKKDEWEEKLYGKYKESGSTDSLKRRSWDPTNRVPLTQISTEEAKEQKVEEVATAPSSPAFMEKSTKAKSEPKPRPLPRSNTMEAINEKSAAENGTTKTKGENKFTKKLKYFRREFSSGHRGDEDKLKGQQFSERIIIGHENEILRNRDAINSSEVSKEVLQKYDGKSKEEMMNYAHHLENEVKHQKQRVKELEDYLDNLLLRVMETQPKILQNPYIKIGPTKR
ncbi:rab11 family-interacting protein 2 isoform X2 [Lutzomyia longipalpis]|uniref:rab11 family-interacting protein 2 isoform X2 n=1 Tax=Lutzomyia longipalpis TaxID=7200 RepID=UPI0024845352|nr:rab11 family-interacting protein 2 isoform X2 [Lutzomyia longipalpis]